MAKKKIKPSAVKKPARKPTQRPRAKTPELFPIVGIGASAGGLEAFIELFSVMPANTGMAFVLVQHLEPHHESLSAGIISRSAKIPVAEVKNGTRILPDHIYVIPPNHNMLVKNGVLELLPASNAQGPRMTIDFFFASLAAEEKSRVIGIVLSGTGSDGTHGLRAIKDEGGLTCAQTPASAKYSFMPQNAIAAGVVDMVLSPTEIARELLILAKNPYLRTKAVSDETPEIVEADPSEPLYDIYNLLKSQIHVDFSDYKPATMARRIQRRMVVQKISNLSAYAEYLQNHPEEVQALYNDMLINVTEFFRDPMAYKALLTDVYPSLIKKNVKIPIRIWVPGCATGEEVYSIAISLLEFMEEHGAKNQLQIFATDISEHCIQHARVGVYSENISKNVSPERLKRFFDRTHDGYKIHKTIRDICLFSRHDVTLDPPFGKLDMISCRNLLIYLGSQLQKRVIPTFHYALNPSGLLWLGRSETPGNAGAKLFTTVNKEAKIYCKINKPTPMNFRFPPRSLHNREVLLPEKPRVISVPVEKGPNFAQDADKIILSRFAPPSVIVNAEMEILQFRGPISKYLEPASGAPSNHLYKMAKPDIISALRSVIQTAKKENKPVRREALHHGAFGKNNPIVIEVLPTNPLALPRDRTYLVLFDEPAVKPSFGKKKTPDKKTKRASRSPEVVDLLRELAENKNYQNSLTEQFDVSQEELTSTIEELQSTNEELQSTNEEMETAKEELQSTNEELTTVNDELQLRNADLAALGSDLNNLLVSTEIPILMVGNDHRIRRFTPKAEHAFNLIPSDVGRPVGQIKSPFDLDFDALVAEVSRDLVPKEIEVQDQQGIWKRVQIRPYKTIENKIDGAIISLMDIENLKQREILSKEALEYVNNIIVTVPFPLVVLDNRLSFKSANRAYYQLFQIKGSREGTEIFEILEMHIGSRLIEISKGADPLVDFDITAGFPRIGERNLLISASVIRGNNNELQSLLLSCVDVTERNLLLRREKEARLEAEQANRTKDLFLATLSHELRTPLSAILTWAQLIKMGKVDFEKAKEGAAVIESSAKTQNQLIDDLLDISRITMGKLALEIKEIDPVESVRLALEAVRPMAHKKNIEINEFITAKSAVILGDAVRLQQIVWNLLTNAIKFSDKAGKIDLKISTTGKHLQIQVVDYGKGIPPEFIKDIFKRFSQADSTSTRVHGGLGLGLAIVSSLVELQGGTVTAENSPSGKGAIFTVAFPLTASDTGIVRNANGSEKYAADLSALKGMRILFVEDDESTREAMEIYFKSFGAQILAVESVARGLEVFGEFKPQILISDIAMAEQNGFDLIRQIRAMPAKQGGRVPAAALTAYATPDDVKLSLDAGFDIHLSKPVEVNFMIEKLLRLYKEKHTEKSGVK
jgi:two-component system CheB/CheR fusion protein